MTEFKTKDKTDLLLEALSILAEAAVVLFLPINWLLAAIAHFLYKLLEVKKLRRQPVLKVEAI